MKRLSVAVVVNYRVDAQGTPQPLQGEELEQIQNLVKQAIGYVQERGDSLQIANAPFNNVEPLVPWWQDAFYLDLAKTSGQYLLILLALMFTWFKIVKPLIKPTAPGVGATSQPAVPPPGNEQETQPAADRYEENLNAIRDIARKDPTAVSMVLRNWMSDNEQYNA